MIEIKDVTKKFKDQTVLDGVTLTCPTGEITGIIGHNGSGKSVLFKCICGLLYADSGEIRVDGQEMKRGGKMIQDAGVIIENPSFLENETGFKNLDYLYCIAHKRDKEQVRQVLKKVGLDPALKKKVKNYSLGMKQRLAIAQAIMEDPHILILDEPMNGLDSHGVDDMRAVFMQEKQKNKTILIASHKKDDIDLLCDHVYRMENGKLQKIR